MAPDLWGRLIGLHEAQAHNTQCPLQPSKVHQNLSKTATEVAASRSQKLPPQSIGKSFWRLQHVIVIADVAQRLHVQAPPVKKRRVPMERNRAVDTESHSCCNRSLSECNSIHRQCVQCRDARPIPAGPRRPRRPVPWQWRQGRNWSENSLLFEATDFFTTFSTTSWEIALKGCA